MPASSARILIVDDEPDVIRVVSSALHQIGLTQLATANDIATARRTWEQHSGNFDLVLTDFSLPDGSAPSFITQLLAAKPEVRVLLMTGYSSDSLALDPELDGKVVLLEKPFRARELQESVRSQLSHVVAN